MVPVPGTPDATKLAVAPDGRTVPRDCGSIVHATAAGLALPNWSMPTAGAVTARPRRRWWTRLDPQRRAVRAETVNGCVPVTTPVPVALNVAMPAVASW